MSWRHGANIAVDYCCGHTHILSISTRRVGLRSSVELKKTKPGGDGTMLLWCFAVRESPHILDGSLSRFRDTSRWGCTSWPEVPHRARRPVCSAHSVKGARPRPCPSRVSRAGMYTCIFLRISCFSHSPLCYAFP